MFAPYFTKSGYSDRVVLLLLCRILYWITEVLMQIGASQFGVMLMWHHGFFFYGLAVPVMPNGHYGGSPMVDEAFTLTLHTSRNSNACYPLSYLVNYSIYLSLDCGVLISIYKCHCSFSRYFVLQISLL